MPTTLQPATDTAAAQPPRLIASVAAVAAVLAATLLLLHPTAVHAARATRPVVSTGKTSLGRVLVDAQGRTLYLFEKDRRGRSACAGQCARFWPPLIATGKPRAAGGVKASLLGTAKRADGRLQVTYDRQPLYTFVKDTRRGQTKGQGVTAFGAPWYVLTPAGAAVR